MQQSSKHFLSEEFCCYDGNHKRTKNYVTLTASVYHSLLQKQVTLAIMECKHEDTSCIETFWRLFNEAFKKQNKTADKFWPIGWSTDMAGSNFAGLERLYGEEVMSKIMGCEFHFKESARKRGRKLGESEVTFLELTTNLLESSTPEAYKAELIMLQDFVENMKAENIELNSWLTWWDERRTFLFRAFKTHEAPRVNQAEVIHAGWSHRDPKGITLLEAAEFDTRDSIILKTEVEAFSKGGISGGSGPNQQKMTERKYHRIMQAAQKKGADLVDYGVSKPTMANASNIVSSNSGCNPPKKKQSSGEILLANRCASAKTSAMVIRKYKELQSLTRTYVVAASCMAHSNYDVQLSNTPSCTCRDFKKNGTRCLCKHIIFILMKVYMLGEDDTILRNR